MVIRKEALVAAMAAAGEEDRRYTLAGVRCEPGQQRLVATDGHILLIVTDREPVPDTDFPIGREAFHGDPSGPVVVSTKVIKSLLTGMPKRTKAVQLGANGTEGGAVMTVPDVELQAPRSVRIDLTEGQNFPDYERIVPKADRESVSVGLSVDVLEALIAAARAVAPCKKGVPTVIRFDVPVGPKDRAKVTGEVTGPVGIRIRGTDLDVVGCAAPCSL